MKITREILLLGCIFIYILLFNSCCRNCDEVEYHSEQQPMTSGVKEVTIIVDEGYDLKDTEAQSLIDSSSMDGDTNKISVPTSFESAIFFLKEGSDEVLAVVRTTPSTSTIIVNANTVTQALMTLVPSYHSLSKTLRDKFEIDAPAVKLYQDFVASVDILLKEGKTIYSDDPEFIDQIVKLHIYINKTYLDIPEQESNGRVQVNNSPTKQFQGDLAFTNWMKRDGGGTVTNNVYSYAHVIFEPLSGGQIVPKLLNPEPFDPREKSQFTLSSLGLKDDCYKVNINQTNSDAVSQNVLGAATTFTGLLFDVIFGYMPGQDKNACIAAIAGSVLTNVTTTVMGAANLSTSDLAEKVGWTIFDGFKSGANQRNCINLLTPEKLLLALGQQSAVMVKVIKSISYVQQTISIISYLYPFVDPININEIIQLYKSQLKEACVKVLQDGTLNDSYAPGEVVSPGIRLEAQSQYAEWIKSGFKVKWITEAGNASTNLMESETNSEGKATVQWTLPDNLSGEVTLRAEILDKEGDHLTGSPIEFAVSVTEGYELKGFWRLNYYTDDSKTTLTESDLINFQNGRDDLGLHISSTYYPDGFTEEINDINFSFLQNYLSDSNRISLTHTFWNIDYQFDYDWSESESEPTIFIGQSIGASNNGYNLTLVKQ